MTGTGAADTGTAFSLQANPFAVLGATPCMPLDELQALAAEVGTPAAAAAARALSVPRSRLPAELGFLPGSAGATPVVLNALRHGQRPDPATLSRAARANLVAHLCAAGLATEGEQDRLAGLQPPFGDAALAEDIDADRGTAGLPPVQRPAMAAEQEALADRHAAALVASCRSGADAAGRLAVLVRAAPDGTGAGFMRRVAAAWSRQTAAELQRLEDAADAAERTALDASSPEATAAFVAGVRAWAAMDGPQRASDGRAGLDHAPALRVLRPWRATGLRLADEGKPELALPLAEALAACFRDLPGEAARLTNDVQGCGELVEERRLRGTLAPLQELVRQHKVHPTELWQSLKDFGFQRMATGPGQELRNAFKAACVACAPSEAPWSVLRGLADEIGADGAVALYEGMVWEAEAAGHTALVARLQDSLRQCQRALALNKLTAAKGAWRQLAALRKALPLAKDAAEQAEMQAREAVLVKKRLNGGLAVGVLLIFVAALFGVYLVDRNYAANAPYRTAAPRALVPDRRMAPPLTPEMNPNGTVEPTTPALRAPAPMPIPTIPAFKTPDSRFGGTKEPAPAGFVLPGQPALQALLRERVLDVLHRPAEYARLGVPPPGGVLLAGPPGCGKSFAAAKLAKFLGWPLHDLSVSAVGSMYLHETSRQLTQAFEAAAARAPGVVLLEELDALGKQRSGGHGATVDEVNTLLRLVEGARHRGLLVVGTTNRLDAIDPALRRRGRFDHVVVMDYADERGVAEMLGALLQDRPHTPTLDLDSAARRLARRPASDAAWVVDEAARLAVVGGHQMIDDLVLARALQALGS